MADDDIPLAPETKKLHSPAAQKLQSQLEPPRRGFIVKLLTLIVGGVATLVPLAAGLATFLDPLRRGKSGGVEPLSIAPLDALPADGVPRLFPVIADRVDAWNRFPDEPVGAVYLRRLEGSDEVSAFNAICPHAGCFVNFQQDNMHYRCPCHTSAFAIDGQRILPCVAPRGLDELACEVREDEGQKQIYVAFENFYPGLPEKLPKA